MPILRKHTELDLEIALKALRQIKTYCGVVCEECGISGFIHPECVSSQKAWHIAVTAIDRIKQVQNGDYTEYDLAKYKSKE